MTEDTTVSWKDMIEVPGTDVSWWQGEVDFVKMSMAGAFYCIIRAGSTNRVTGENYYDYALATNGPAAEAIQFSKGFYWYYREFGRQHAIGQARFFWEHTKGFSIEEGLFIDVETYDANLWNVKAFLEELGRLSGLPKSRLGVYSRGELFQFIGGAYHPWLLDYMCWVARYHSGIDHPWGDDDRWRMYPFADPDYWQHSADNNHRGPEFGVESKSIDLNKKYIAPIEEPGEEDPPELPAPWDALQQLWDEGLRHGWDLSAS